MEIDKPIRCAVMGQHPLRFPWGFDEEDDRCRKLKIELAQQIMVLRQSGVSQFLTACDCGVGLYAAEIINGLRTTDHDLMLLCYTPHEEQATVLRGTLYCCCESPLRMRMSGQSVYWVCIRHSHNASACPITQIPETQVQQAFLRLYYNLKHQGSHILSDFIANLQSIRERKFLWSVDVIELNKQIAELTSQNQLLTTLKESGCVDPDIFISKSNALTEQLRAAKQAKSRILNQDGDDTIPCTQELITILKRGPETLHDFDGELFGQLIDKVIIESNTSLRFRLKNGLELREGIERTVR